MQCRVSVAILKIHVDSFCEQDFCHLRVSLNRSQDEKGVAVGVDDVVQVALVALKDIFHQATVSGVDGSIHSLHKLCALFFMLFASDVGEMLRPC